MRGGTVKGDAIVAARKRPFLLLEKMARLRLAALRHVGARATARRALEMQTAAPTLGVGAALVHGPWVTVA